MTSPSPALASAPPASYVPMGDLVAGFNAYIGGMLVDPGKGPGEPERYAFMPGARHLNGGGALHGGLLMTLADTFLGAAVHEAIEGRVCSTVVLNTDFLAGGAADAPVFATARITRKTRSLVFVSGELTQKGRVLMTASGIWKVLGA